MKKLIVLAMLGISLASFQHAKAQVSLNVNIGTPANYGYSSYYVPAQPVVYVVRPHHNYNHFSKRNVVVYRNQPVVQRSYYTNYRSANRYYAAKKVNYKHDKHSFKHSRGHGKGRH